MAKGQSYAQSWGQIWTCLREKILACLACIGHSMGAGGLHLAWETGKQGPFAHIGCKCCVDCYVSNSAGRLCRVSDDVHHCRVSARQDSKAQQPDPQSALQEALARREECLGKLCKNMVQSARQEEAKGSRYVSSAANHIAITCAV